MSTFINLKDLKVAGSPDKKVEEKVVEKPAPAGIWGAAAPESKNATDEKPAESDKNSESESEDSYYEPEI